MPSCWFLLTKQYLRVDGALVRCREVRLFHRFPESAPGAPAEGLQVHMEVCWRELEAPPSPAPSHSPSPLPNATTLPSRGAGAATAAATVEAPPARLPTPPAAVTAAWRSPPAGPGNQEALLMSAQGRNMTHLLPLVNDLEGIGQFYTLHTNSL
jgi:hypothetical protein